MIDTSDDMEVESLHADDLETVQQLARIQQMHEQAQKLRDLLPGRLIGPMRDAIERPQPTDPQMLAMTLRQTVKTGIDEITNFKKDWHDEQTREVLKAANASDVSQGCDYWTVDYTRLLKTQQQDGTTATDYGTRFDNLQETALGYHNFQDKKYEHSRLELQDPSKEVPLIFTTRKLTITIDKNEQEGCYELALAPEDQQCKVTRMAFEAISQTGPWKSLEKLLDMLISYRDVRLRPCEKCHKLLNKNLDVPTVRVLKKVDGATSWEAYHYDHVP